MTGRKANLKAETSHQNRLIQSLKNDLVAGLLVIIPLATTIWLTFSLATWSIDLLTSIPKQLNPFVGLHPILGNSINFAVGLTVPLVGLLLVGLMVRNIFGQWLLKMGEMILQAIPLAGSIYKTLKQILETILRDSNDKFRRVVLIEYPRSGIWRLGFVTGAIGGEIETEVQQPMLSIFLPTSPNPATGWYAIVPEKDVINLSMSVEDAFKLIISAGIVVPESVMPNMNKLPLVGLEMPVEGMINEQQLRE